jgi:uncharacterized protein YbgA (DUF1722 family)
MRSLLAIWLITLLSLTPSDLSAVDQSPRFLHGTFDSFLQSTQHLPRRAVPGESAFYTKNSYFERSQRSQLLIKEGTPIPFDEYWELVRDTRQAIRQSEAKPEATIRQELDALSAQWDQVTAVELSDGSLIQIDSAYLVAQLRFDPPDLKRLGNLLDALLRAHEEYPQKVFTLEDVAPLQEILARPEFQWQQQQPLQLPNWLERFLDWIERFRNRTLNTVYRYGRTPLIIAATLLFILSLYFISRGLSRSLVKEAELETEGNERDEMLTSKGALKRAETLSTQGDYRNAIRYLYLSSLLVLDEQGLMRYDRSRTNREYLRSVSSKPELAKPLSDVIDVFDRVWYGFETVDEQTYQSYVRRVDELREKKE